MLPELRCNTSAACYGYIAGNAPEVIPLDASLLSNLDKGVEQNATCTMPCNNLKKFSFSTRSHASSAFRQV